MKHWQSQALTDMEISHEGEKKIREGERKCEKCKWKTRMRLNSANSKNWNCRFNVNNLCDLLF